MVPLRPADLMVRLAVKTLSEANLTSRWGKINRVKNQRREVERAFTLPIGSIPSGPWGVRLTRYYRSRPLDTDNCTIAVKATRDSIASVLGVDDGSPYVGWVYAQTKGPIGVLVEIWGLKGP